MGQSLYRRSQPSDTDFKGEISNEKDKSQKSPTQGKEKKRSIALIKTDEEQNIRLKKEKSARKADKKGIKASMYTSGKKD